MKRLEKKLQRIEDEISDIEMFKGLADDEERVYLNYEIDCLNKEKYDLMAKMERR